MNINIDFKQFIKGYDCQYIITLTLTLTLNNSLKVMVVRLWLWLLTLTLALNNSLQFIDVST